MSGRTWRTAPHCKLSLSEVIPASGAGVGQGLTDDAF